jgi:hypothetical protein
MNGPPFGKTCRRLNPNCEKRIYENKNSQCIIGKTTQNADRTKGHPPDLADMYQRTDKVTRFFHCQKSSRHKELVSSGIERSQRAQIIVDAVHNQVIRLIGGV